MAAETETPSFFVLLDLDPDEPWDQARFEKVLKEKHSRWSLDRVKATGPRKAAADRYAPLVPEIHAALSDPARRAEHAERARAALASGARAAQEELEAELDAKGARGFLVPAEVTELLRRYGPRLGEPEVRSRLSRLPVRDEAASAPAAEPLDPSIKGRIDELLRRAGLGGRTLYAFLLNDGATPAQSGQVTSQALHARARGIYDEVSRATAKTAELTVRQELAGLCMTCLGSDEQRDRYDATVAAEGIAEILKKARVAAGPTRALTLRQVDALVRDAQAAGVGTDEARARLQAFAHAERWSLEVPATDGLLPCACGTYNDPAAACCGACGEPLRLSCPRCGEPAAAAAAACSRCGFPLGNRFLVRVILDEARTLASGGDPAAAQERLAEAERAWPAATGDPLGAEVAAERARAGQAAAAAEAALEELRALLAAHRPCAAVERAAALRQAGVRHPGVAELAARARGEVDQAEREMREVARLPAGEEAAARALRVLAACADCEPARRLLEATPPAAPAGLGAQVRGGTVALSWRAGASPQAGYVVVRKARARPAGPADGARLARVEGTRYDDDATEAGVELYYAVFAERAGVASREAAHLTAPVLVVAEVAGLTARVGDGEVQLAWTPPPNVERVYAVRREPGSAGAGVRVDSADGRQVVDRGLVNGREYRYTVHCEFRTGAGDALASAGAGVTAVPQVPPPRVERLEFTPAETAEGRVLRVSWTPPPRGEVRILATPEPVALEDEILPARELARRGEVLAGTRPPVNDPWREGAVRCYTPVLVLGEAAYPGPSHRHVFLDDVAGVQAVYLGDRVRLTWTWPAGCAEAEVACGADDWPDAHPAAAGWATRVSRAEYDRAGGCELRAPDRKESDLYFVVRAVATVDGDRVLSGGTSAGARRKVPLRSRMTLEYEVLGPGLLRRTPRLRLRPSREAELPPLRLVRKRGAPPATPADGECVLRLGPTRVTGETDVPISGVATDGRAFARLFLESDQDYEWTTILQPDRAKLQL